MRDQVVSLPRINGLHPTVRQQVINSIEEVEKGFPVWMAVRVVEATRSIEYQNELYAQGRTKPGKIVTNAKGGQSYHNYGLAIDFAILVDANRDGKYDTLSWDTGADMDKDQNKDWLEVAKVFKAAGFEWGGDFQSIKDYPHFQRSFGYSVQQLLTKYNNRIFLDNSKFIKL